jgi:uncharacterized protein YprB with RNaseH-like and TPR domain
MLRNTFCHIPGVGPKTERSLWEAGITTWETLLAQSGASPPAPLRRSCAEHLHESLLHYTNRNANYFGDRLPASQRWRLFSDFRSSCAYLDIETTGMGHFGDHITSIALYDGQYLRVYVHGENLDDFLADVRNYRLLVTYNGTGFDLPFLQRHFLTTFPIAHIDLRYVLKSLGIGGGLKGCEQRLGIKRPGLEEVDGYLAVLLWRDYQRHRNRKALETLLAYNTQDAVNLETLLVEAYNRKIQETPFALSHRLPAPSVPANPFTPDADTVRRLLHANPWSIPFAR